ncbi:MAG: phosphopantetheine-binding protein [Campylobacteraceae bacterium]|jgi:acyl carrier protein|nr:phosphopantetheine-binding protein [Campylobacteraceae bacterium]
MVTSENLKALIIKSLKLEDIGIDDIRDDMPLFGSDGLGLDSVDSIELVLTIEREYGVKIGRNENYQEIFSSISALLNFINAQK